ncbi:hypothetical protein D9Q98_003048 [Chlorella vulgaris]|uniref:VWFA domain-containing protein n=1 Tax=Chlorella vulgaris TaxID=3077 RepID=A0A9D4TUK0_CHLVU|nr:hypothetical protein D9Q98_003048 [Chlorella vulgaris]
MKQFVAALRQVSEAAPNDNVEENSAREEEEQAADANCWDAKALQSMDPYCQGTAAGPFAGQTKGGVGRRLLGAMPQMVTGRSRSGGGQLCMARGGGPAPPMAPMPLACAAMAPGGAAFGGSAEGCAIGFKTGGAQDAANFRANVEAGQLPLPSDVTYEGLIKDYYFDTSPTSTSEWVDVAGGAKAEEAEEPPHAAELFTPSYSLALAPDPLLCASTDHTQQQQQHVGRDRGSEPDRPGQQYQPDNQGAKAVPQDVFLAVGLDSGITDFRRPRLNLNILLDVSGSMDCCFTRQETDPDSAASLAQRAGAEARPSKLDVAKQVLKSLLDRLAPDDSVSISLFSDRAATPKRMGRWGHADAAGVKAGIDTLHTVGGTNFQAGLDEATAQLRKHADCIDGDPATTENRMIVLTDAEANCGDLSETGLLARLKANAADRLHTTIVGVGLDFQTTLVEGIMKVRGANYFSVHTAGEFKKRLDDAFDFLVAPLVFDLELRVDPASLAPHQPDNKDPASAPPAAPEARPQDSSAGTSNAGSAGVGGWKVLHVYGSPDSEERRLSGGGSIMRVNTLFPAAKSEEGIKGGVVLLRMRPPPGTTLHTAPPLRLSARYVDRAGKQYESLRVVEVPPEAVPVSDSHAEGGSAVACTPAYFQSSGVRKAVVLARLVDALQCWLVDEWTRLQHPKPPSADSWDAGVAAGLGAAQGVAAAPAPNIPPQLAPRPPLHLRAGWPLLPPDSSTLQQTAAGSGDGPGMAALPTWMRRQARLAGWERGSMPLQVGAEAKAALLQLLHWLKSEVAALGDDVMQQEVMLLQKILVAA